MTKDAKKPLLTQTSRTRYDGNQAQPKSTSCNCRAVACYTCAGVSEGIGATLLFATLKVFPASAAATGIGCSALWILGGIGSAASQNFFCAQPEPRIPTDTENQQPEPRPTSTLSHFYAAPYVPPRTRTEPPQNNLMAT